MLFYFIFVGALAAADAIGNETVAKDKRQVQHEATQNFVPSNHQPQIGGQQHYAPSNEQISAHVTPNYYRYVQKLVQEQQQPQQFHDAPKDITPQHHQPRHHTQPIKQNQFVYYNEPQVQYQPEVENPNQLEPKVISEEEYLELVRRQNGENANNTAAAKHQSNRGGQYKTQPTYVPQHPQSYLKSYVNPLGEFSLEKELAQLEKSNKAIYHSENSEKHTEQSLKKERYDFKPSHQFVEYQQQDQFLPSEYAQYSGSRPVSQKLISNPYEREESASEKTNNNQPEYQIRFTSPTENPAKYYQEAIKTGPKNAFVPLPKHQYLAESNTSPQANANLAKKHSQLIYQKQHQHAAPPSVQQSPKGSPQKQPTKAVGSYSEKLPQFQANNQHAPSQSSIFVSQGTGISQKQQQAEHEQQQQEIQQNHQVQNNQQQQQYDYQQHSQNHQRIPPTHPNRPLTQEEFQALVDAGYKVQAIPIPVPVPVSAEVYAQHQQQQQQLHQHQQPHHSQYEHQQHQHPYQLQQQQQANSPARPQYQPQSNPSIRPQASNKHFIRYHQQPTEGVLTSYLRPFLEQYNNLMGGKN